MINALQSAWGSSSSPLLVSGALQVDEPPISLTYSFLYAVDRWGRRQPLIIGAVLLAGCMAMEAGTSSHFANPDYHNPSMGIAGVAAVFLFSWLFSFSFSFGPGE
jgi:uncharacterized BrkB/YihY/UPF0761 family membrane protein